MRSFAHRVCVCVRERERERESHHSVVCVCVIGVVCVCERESHITVSCVCVCVRERERERERARRSHHREVYSPSEIVLIVACVQTHTIITVSVTRLCSPLGLELMLKLRTLLTVLTFILKADACDYGNGRYISDECLWFSANHNALCQLTNQSRLCLSEGGTL